MTRRKISINPISRVEGHGKVVLFLDDDGRVSEARFHVMQFRGFEAFCQGRPYEEMPIITQRICGICPVSHQLASAKACDMVMGVPIPETAVLLRELLHMGQYIQSHALHFFYLASPDLLLGWEADPGVRNVAGVMEKYPELAVKGIRLRAYGQEIIRTLGGKSVHPAYSVPGGVSEPLDPPDRDRLASGLAEARETCGRALDLLLSWIDENWDEVKRFGNFPSMYMGLVDEDDHLALYDGRLRLVDDRLFPRALFNPASYGDYLGEHVEAWSYMKFPYYKAQGYPRGIYRVGPLARLNVAKGIYTPAAGKEFAKFKAMADNGLAGSSLLYHYARLIELLYALERAEELFSRPNICEREIKATTRPKGGQGVGVVEAPRGTLIHHYWVDERGVMEKVNLIVATGHNNLAMNLAVTEVAREYIDGRGIEEGLLNRVEGAIRCYDPCLSCATHAWGQMPLEIRVVGTGGEVIHVLRRD